MPCFSPLKGYRSADPDDRRIKFSPRSGFNDLPIDVPCGQCRGCRIDRARSWMLRCVHEASLYDENCFVTLTYDDEHLPENRSLSPLVVTKFMKDLRRKYYPKRIRFFACGEYGDQKNRPHYHILLFNHDFKDKYKFGLSKNLLDNIYRSAELESIWTNGFSTIGSVNRFTAMYVSDYCLKKTVGKDVPDFYEIVDTDTGEIFEVRKEFQQMSRMPGIGKPWFDAYTQDCRKDFVTFDGTKVPLPKYYRDKLKQIDPSRSESNESERRKRARKSKDNTHSRLKARSKCLDAKLKNKKRRFENA